MITSKTKKVGLICWPIGHSLSPVMQNAAFQFADLDWVYLPLEVAEENLESALRGLPALGFEGCNISVPYKSVVIPCLDEVDDASKKIGAVNTIKVVNGRLYGSNTDPIGFANNMAEYNVDAEGKKVFVIGAGGAARAAVYAFSRMRPIKVFVTDVDQTKLEQFVSDLSDCFEPDVLEMVPFAEAFNSEKIDNYELVVNATPIGMAPRNNESPWPDDVDLPNSAVFYDVVYNPELTKFLARAQNEGHQIVKGLGMLIHQGAASYKTWTGEAAPVDIMRSTCLSVFGQQR